MSRAHLLPATNMARIDTVHAEVWQAWKIGERESHPIALDGPETVDEVMRQVLAKCSAYRRDKFAVLRIHHGRAKQTLWLFTIKQSTRVFDYRAAYDGGRPVREGRLYPELLLQTEVASFALVEPFDAFRDDPVGRDPHLVEVAP